MDQGKLITWSDYRREDGDLCFARCRPMAGTVNDRAPAVYQPELMFSQRFFLIKGLLAIYDRQAKTFRSLPGTDTPDLVLELPAGKTIMLARSTAYELEGLEHVRSVVVPPEVAEVFVKGERTFRYDLYRIPSNERRGGC